MTTLTSVSPSVSLPPFGNWTRYILTAKDHEDWVFESTQYYNRSNQWWTIDFNAMPMSPQYSNSPAMSEGWMKFNNQGAEDFKGWRTPFFQDPEYIYKALRLCLRHYNNSFRYYNNKMSNEDQKKIWHWAFENLIVYKITFNLNTLTATKEQIDFKKDCCPKSISPVST